MTHFNYEPSLNEFRTFRQKRLMAGQEHDISAKHFATNISTTLMKPVQILEHLV